MKTGLLILLLFISCHKGDNRIQSNETLDYHNFIHESEAKISQIENLYKIDLIFDIHNFNVTNDSLFRLDYIVKGDLFNVIFDKSFLKRYDNDHLNMSVIKNTSKLYYLGKFKESIYFQSQIFLLKITDANNTFYLNRLIILNSKNNTLLSSAILSENLCSEECVGKNSKKIKKNIYSIETITYSTYTANPLEDTEAYFTLFKINKDGYVEFIKD